MLNDSRQILISPLFLIGLTILLLNDFVLKNQFHNFLTGKLSDFAGLFIFPLFFSAFFPKRKFLIYVLTSVLFVFWKSPFSQGLIHIWNSLGLFGIGRTIDYSDLLSLSMLSFSYFYSKTIEQKMFSVDFTKRIYTSFVILLSIFAFTATSYKEDRNVNFDKSYTFKGSKEQLIANLKNLPITSKLQFRSETEILGNTMPQNKIDAEQFWLDFTIKRKFCGSNELDVRIFVKEVKEATNLDSGYVRFWCQQEPTEETKKQILQLFENEIAEKLKLSSQNTKANNEIGN